MSFKKIFLIDFENVSSEGLTGIDLLTENDKVVIFYSEQNNRITLGTHITICNSDAKYEYYDVVIGGKNALDIQLASYLGYLIGCNAAEEYYIISNDEGYKFVSSFWATHNTQTKVKCLSKIKNHLVVPAASKTTTVTPVAVSKAAEAATDTDNVSEIAQNFSNAYPKLVAANLNTFIAVKDLMALYKYIVKALGQEEGVKVYKNLKEALKKLK